jgi:Spy/CpxP family protein refolding chaperone
MSSDKFSLRKILMIGSLALALPVGLAVAQPAPGPDPGGPGGPGGRMGMGPAQRVLRGALAQLDLSQEQKDKIKAVIEAEKAGMQTMGARHRADALTLRDLAAAAQPDPKAVGDAFLKVKQNREAAKAAREKVLGKIEAVLTPAQKARFQGYIQAAKDAVHGGAGRRAWAASFR